jgi:hypothetical protein
MKARGGASEGEWDSEGRADEGISNRRFSVV